MQEAEQRIERLLRLNDGICVPTLFLFIALAVGADTGDSRVVLAIKLVVRKVGIGLVVGLGMAALGARILQFRLSSV